MALQPEVLPISTTQDPGYPASTFRHTGKPWSCDVTAQAPSTTTVSGEAGVTDEFRMGGVRANIKPLSLSHSSSWKTFEGSTVRLWGGLRSHKK